MGKQTNAPKEWRLLAERDMAAAEYKDFPKMFQD
jgi:hypothetical protein